MFIDRLQRYGKVFLLTVLALALCLVGAAVLASTGVFSESATLRGVGVLVTVLGLLFVVAPFTTPETMQVFGVRRSLLIARAIGMVTMAVGVFLSLSA